MNRILYAFYDLHCAPPTYDIVKFLILAEIERIQFNCSNVHVIIPPGPENGFRKGNLELFHKLKATEFNVESLRWRLRNILLHLPWTLPSCNSVSTCSSRHEAEIIFNNAFHVFPRNYSVENPITPYQWRWVLQAYRNGHGIPTLRASEEAIRHVKKWIKLHDFEAQKVVTLTIRDCPYFPDRNSQLSHWRLFADTLKEMGYIPVAVRDTETAFSSSSEWNCTVFFEPSWNIDLRLALYEVAFVNLFTNGGPANMCRLDSHCSSINFVFTSSVFDKQFFQKDWGISPGEQFPFHDDNQRLEWKKDEYENILNAFCSFRDAV